MNIKLSVIVPVYNVSNYLEECLNSILNQKIEDMEIIVVDDGSTDNSLEIAERYEEQYSEVKVIAQKNGGLGNARNTGMKFAKGQYLTFVDSDDIIPQNAYSHMMKKIEVSQSDFVIGNVVRFNSTKTYASVLHKRVFKEDLTRVNIKTHPELIYDTTAWNKIFRKSFWEKHQFKFPEGMLYEDIPVTIPAHTLAEHVDVVTKVTYKWRSRDSGDSSITQQREDISNFRDRVKAIEMVRDFFLENNIESDIINDFDLKNLSMDFPIYMKYMTDVTKDYQNLFFKYIGNYMNNVSQDVYMELTVLQRLKYKLIQHKRYRDFLTLLKNDKKSKNALLPVKYNNGLSFNYDFIDILSKEERMASTEFIPVSWVEKAYWKDSNLRVEGVFYLKGLSMAKKNSIKVTPFLISKNTNKKVSINNKVKSVFRPDVTLKRGQDAGSKVPFKRKYNYNFSGYQLDISFSKLENELLSNEEYKLVFEVEMFGIRKMINVGSPLPGSITKPKPKIINDNSIVPNYNAAWELYVTKMPECIIANSIHDDKESLSISGKLKDSVPYKRAVLLNLTTNEEVNLELTSENEYFSIKLNKALLLEHYNKFYSTSWRVFLIDENNEMISVFVSDGLIYKTFLLDDIQVTITQNKVGELQIRVSDYLPLVQSVELNNKTFIIKTKILKTVFNNSIDTKVLLKNGIQEIECKFELFDEDENNHIVNIHIPMNNEIITKIKEKNYNLLIQKKMKLQTFDNKIKSNIDQVSIENDSELDIDITDSMVGDELEGIETNYDQVSDKPYEYMKNIPLYLFKEGYDKTYFIQDEIRYELYRPRGESILKFRRFSFWSNLDNGPRRREIVKKVFYPLWRKLPIKNNVFVYESFWGREFNDNPKALYEYVVNNKSDIKNIICIKDTLTPINIIGNTEVVKYKSWKYYYYLARGKYFFNNVNFPDDYRKRKNAIEVQTMHGTPLKKLGLDNPGEIPENKVDKFIGKCERWDYLTVPSDYVADIAKSAYKFSGTILKTGYPRNDILLDNKNDKNLHDLKKLYNIPQDKKVILYAPTWRVKGKFSMPIDLNLLKEQLGDEYILIVKLHHFMQQNFSLKGLEDFVYVFGKNTDISEFYILSDILITDYSSVMFDFALLKKPMIFYAYDYENYKKNQRDIYFDFQKEAPGAFISTSDEIVFEIKNIEDYFERYKKQIKYFNHKYNQYDNGTASKQVLETIFKKS